MKLNGKNSIAIVTVLIFFVLGATQYVGKKDDSTILIDIAGVASLNTNGKWSKSTSPNSANIIEVINGATLNREGEWTNASDISLKENIRDLEYGLDEVLQLEPKVFSYKKTNTSKIGFIAQDVEEIVPEVVTEGINGLKSLSYDTIVALNTKAIIELNDKILALESGSSSTTRNSNEPEVSTKKSSKEKEPVIEEEPQVTEEEDAAPEEEVTEENAAPDEEVTEEDAAPDEEVTEEDAAPEEEVTEGDAAPEEEVTEEAPEEEKSLDDQIESVAAGYKNSNIFTRLKRVWASITSGTQFVFHRMENRKDEKPKIEEVRPSADLNTTQAASVSGFLVNPMIFSSILLFISSIIFFGAVYLSRKKIE